MTVVLLKTSRPLFLKKNGQLQDMVAAHLAQDIETKIKNGGRTPVKKGIMKGAVRHYKAGQGRYIVESPEEYSATQELGVRRGTNQFKNYTTAGTGKGWFSGAINSVIKNVEQEAKKVARSLNL